MTPRICFVSIKILNQINNAYRINIQQSETIKLRLVKYQHYEKKFNDGSEENFKGGIVTLHIRFAIIRARLTT